MMMMMMMMMLLLTLAGMVPWRVPWAQCATTESYCTVHATNIRTVQHVRKYVRTGH